MDQDTSIEPPITPSPMQRPENDAMDVSMDDSDCMSTSVLTLSNLLILTSTLVPSMASSSSVMDPSSPSVPPATTQFSSKRGLSMNWRSDGDVAQRYSLSEPMVQLLSDLFSTSLSILNGEREFVDILQTMVQDVYRQSVTSSAGTNVLGQVTVNDPISLGVIAGRIKKSNKTGIMLEYESSLSLIQFIVKLDVLRETRGVNSTMDIIREEMKPGGSLGSDEGKPIFSESQVKDWRQCGYQLAEFAGAGKQHYHSYLNDL